jgi:glycosyltransferase involved in cell wall biosynthesis
MRILMLSQFYPPVPGGEEQHVRALSAALAARGHTVAVATQWQRGLPEIEQEGPVRVYRERGTVQRLPWLYQDAERHHTPPLPDPEMTWALRRVLARERPQIVHAHNWLIHSYLPLHRPGAARLVLTLHDYSLLCAKKRLMYEGLPCSGPAPATCLRCATAHYGRLKGTPTVLATMAMRQAEHALVRHFVPVSQAVADGNALARHHLPHTVIPNFVPDDVATLHDGYQGYLEQLPQGEYLLFVGDLSPDKGLPVLLEAYAGLEEAPPLVLIGRQTPDTPTSLPPGVRVLGTWPREAVMWAWSRSLLGVVPSVWPDPCPSVIMEAMAAGRPVLGSRLGGIPDLIVDGETGLLAPPGDVAALRQALAYLLANPDLRARLGWAARERAPRFQAQAVVPRIERLYQDLLDEAAGPRADLTGSGSERRSDSGVKTASG